MDKMKETQTKHGNGRERLGEEILASERRFKATFESAAVGMAHAGLDGSFLQVNQKLSEILGYSQDEILKTNFRDITHPDDLPAQLAQIQQLREGKIGSYSMEKRYIRKDGSVVWANLTASLQRDDDGQPEYFIVVVEDITERKRTEEALRVSDERFRVAITGSPISVYQHDKDLRFTWAYNPHPGLSAEDFLGKTIEDVYAPEDAARLTRMKRQVIDSGVGTRGETWLTVDGEVRFVDFSAEPLRDGAGQITGVTCATVDITERKRAEEALKMAYDELENRVLERTVELRNEIEERKRAEEALRASEGELRYLSSQLLNAQEKERRQVAEELHDNIWQSLNTIKLDMDRFLSQQVTEIPAASHQTIRRITSNIEDTVERIRSLRGDLWPSILDGPGVLVTINWYCREFEKKHAGISVEKEIGVTEEEVPAHVRIVIYRVMQEALKNVALHSGAARVSISLKKEQGRIEFTINDNGGGFDLDVLFRTRPWMGFGLVAMRERVEYSGGSFKITSEVGIGTTIQTSWPSQEEGSRRLPFTPL